MKTRWVGVRLWNPTKIQCSKVLKVPDLKVPALKWKNILKWELLSQLVIDVGGV